MSMWLQRFKRSHKASGPWSKMDLAISKSSDKTEDKEESFIGKIHMDDNMKSSNFFNFKATAPPAVETALTNLEVQSEILITTDLAIGSMNTVYCICDKFKEDYRGPEYQKDIAKSILAILITHLRVESVTNHTRCYKGEFNDVIQLSLTSDHASTKAWSVIESKSLFYRFQKQVSMKIKIKFKQTQLRGIPYLELYKLPMSNGSDPPLIDSVLQELEMTNYEIQDDVFFIV
ncbi:matrix [Marco virus]|uniref:Matrix n=1 Tax=Marco virus TaxID=1158190 RepID=A0A0D3R1V5_9RHAB|nr:matrix [Marco virus]AJR28450.1 matrix [Marco virus]